MNIVILDNFDSFTFNLVEEFNFADNHLHVWRNSIDVAEAMERLLSLKPPRLLVLSPGPGHPDDAGCMNALLKKLLGKVPIFGVCLGMQAMVSIFGGEVSRANNIVHGKARLLEHDGSLIFSGLKNRIHVGRYHSLAATKLPKNLRVFGHSEGLVMAVADKKTPTIGVQFHPESILSTAGSKMIKNAVRWAKESS